MVDSRAIFTAKKKKLFIDLICRQLHIIHISIHESNYNFIGGISWDIIMAGANIYVKMSQNWNLFFIFLENKLIHSKNITFTFAVGFLFPRPIIHFERKIIKSFNYQYHPTHHHTIPSHPSNIPISFNLRISLKFHFFFFKDFFIILFFFTLRT